MNIPLRILTKFGASKGAWSEVTAREVYDSQITLTGDEQVLVERHFHGDIHVGNVKSDPAAARKMFRRHPVGALIRLNLVYPKPSKAELRLYLREQSYKPRAGEVWFIYEKGGELYLGAMARSAWDAL
jgi:hypothetical protein